MQALKDMLRAGLDQVLHDSGTKTGVVRHTVHLGKESLKGLIGCFGTNAETVAKWRKPSSVSALATGPRVPRSAVLSPADEAIIVAFRRHAPPPLGDCLDTLQATARRQKESNYAVLWERRASDIREY